VEADVEEPLDDDRLVARRPHDRCARAAFQRHELRHEGGHVIGRVLAVEKDPVETGKTENLCRDWGRQRGPASDQALAAAQVGAELVGKRSIRNS
jgi:hypothetical protein